MVDEKTAKRGLALVVTTLLLDIIGIAIIMPVLPTFLRGTDRRDTSARRRSTAAGCCFVYAAMQFLFAPLIGNLSDRFGRRPVLLASVFTFAIDNLICAIALVLLRSCSSGACSPGSAAPASPPLPPILPTSAPTRIGRRISACSASLSASGFVIGPVLGGFLGEFGPRVPFYGAAALVVPQLPGRLFSCCRKRWKSAPAPFRLAARQSARRAQTDAQLSRHRLDRPCLLPVLALAHAVYPAVWSFVSDLPLRLERGADRLVARGFRPGRRLRHGGRSAAPRAAARRVADSAIGLTFTMVAAFGYAAAWQGWMVYVVMVSSCLEALADPPLRSLAAAKVPPSAQGELQGAMTSLFSITAIITPLIYTQIFAAFTGPNAPVRVRWRTLCARRHFHRDFVGGVPAEGGKTGCACGRSRAGDRLEPSFRLNRNEALSPCWSRIFSENRLPPSGSCPNACRRQVHTPSVMSSSVVRRG